MGRRGLLSREGFLAFVRLRWLGLLLPLAALAGAAGACNKSPAANASRASTPSRPPVPSAKSGIQRTFTLVPGPGRPQQLSGGEVHGYEIDLAAGSYLAATFEQQGVDLAIEVFAPGHQRLYRIDNPNRSRGPEDVHLVAAAAGRYRFELTTKVGAPSGTYTSELRAVRAPSETDRSQAAGDLAFYEAKEIDSDPARFWESVAKYEQAILLFQEAGDRFHQAHAYFRLARLYRRQTRSQEALGLFARAEKLFQELGALHHLTLALNEQGVCAEELADYERASLSYRRALELARRTGDENDQAAILHNSGKLLQLQGRPWEALGAFREALALWRRATGDDARANEAETLTGIGWVYQSTGDWQRAIDAHEQALHLRNRLGDLGLRSVSLTQIGSVWAAVDPRRALPWFETARDLQKDVSDAMEKAATLNGLGLAYVGLERYDEAQSAYQKALELYRSPVDLGGQGITWTNLGWTAVSLGKPDEATRRFETALHLARQTRNPMAEGRALLGIAYAERQRGNNALAQLRAEDSLRIVESLRWAAARADLQTSYLASNENAYSLLIRILMERHRQQPGGGFDLQALGRSEQSRARVLLDAMKESRDLEETMRSASPELQARHRALLDQVGVLDSRRRRLDSSPAEAAAAEQALAALLDRLSEEETAHRRQGLEGREMAPPPSGVEGLQRSLLEPDTLLLEYHLGNPQSYLWAISAGGVQSFELPGQQSLEPLLRSVYEELAGMSAGGEPGASRSLELSRILLGPLASQLRGKRLVIAADGIQQTIPFAALPSPAGSHPPLILDNEVVFIPSLAVLGELRGRAARRKPPLRDLALVADPVFDASDERLEQTEAARPRDSDPEDFLPRLSRTRDEAKVIAGLLPAGKAFTALDFDASRELVTSGGLSPFRTVHFATHGLQRIDHPELSSIVLSRFDRNGAPRDGYLRVSDISGLHLQADLVVLSACETALGKPAPGEGLVGLPQAFLAAGAQRVLVSLWQVEDESAAALMTEFYRHLLVDRRSPGQALREAQLAIRAQPRWRAPRYWAGFVLQGDWR